MECEVAETSPKAFRPDFYHARDPLNSMRNKVFIVIMHIVNYDEYYKFVLK